VFVFLLVFASDTVFSQCKINLNHNLIKAKLKYVIDGDTIVLQNNKRVRLLGINTPEIAHKKYKPKSEDELFGLESKLELKKLLENKNIYLFVDNEKRDKYGRLLAWVFDSKKKLVVENIIGKGLGFWEPNYRHNRFIECLKKVEEKSRKAKLGIWGEKYYRAINANSIHKKGFQLVKGVLERGKITKKYIWLVFQSKNKNKGYKNRTMLMFSRKHWDDKKDIINNLIGKKVVFKGRFFSFRKTPKSFKANVMHEEMFRILR
jgi:endonuclease YncB( thermonuclease family)